MSDWKRRRTGSPISGPLVKAVTVVLVAVIWTVAVFAVARSTAPQMPAAGQGPAAEVVTSLLPVDDRGVPFGYGQDQAGAEAAALNAVIGGLWLRGSTQDRGMGGMVADRGQDSPAVRLLMNPGLRAFTGADSDKVPQQYAQRDVYDFAPDPATAGWLTAAQVRELPITVLAPDFSGAAVSFTWVEQRTDGDAVTESATAFRIDLVWEDEDWKVAEVAAQKSDTSWDAMAWLLVLGFVGQAQS